MLSRPLNYSLLLTLLFSSDNCYHIHSKWWLLPIESILRQVDDPLPSRSISLFLQINHQLFTNENRLFRFQMTMNDWRSVKCFTHTSPLYVDSQHWIFENGGESFFVAENVNWGLRWPQSCTNVGRNSIEQSHAPLASVAGSNLLVFPRCRWLTWLKLHWNRPPDIRTVVSWSRFLMAAFTKGISSTGES